MKDLMKFVDSVSADTLSTKTVPKYPCPHCGSETKIYDEKNKTRICSNKICRYVITTN